MRPRNIVTYAAPREATPKLARFLLLLDFLLHGPAPRGKFTESLKSTRRLLLGPDPLQKFLREDLVPMPHGTADPKPYILSFKHLAVYQWCFNARKTAPTTIPETIIFDLKPCAVPCKPAARSADFVSAD